MRARDRRYGKSPVKTRVGIATAVLVGGAVAAAAVVASHGAAPAATSASYSSRFGNEGTILSSAMTNWNASRQSSYAQLAQLTQARQFSQTTHRGKVLAVQRGIVVLATKKFLILQSSNGSLHLWLLSGKTQFQNVSNTMAGTQALTASTSAAQQAMWSGNMLPATSLLAGSPIMAATLLTPTPAALTAMPTWNPTTFTQNAWLPMKGLARGDLALVVGTRSHWTLKAQLVLFTPLSTATVGGKVGTGTTTGTTPGTGTTPVVTPTAVATHW